MQRFYAVFLPTDLQIRFSKLVVFATSIVLVSSSIGHADIFICKTTRERDGSTKCWRRTYANLCSEVNILNPRKFVCAEIPKVIPDVSPEGGSLERFYGSPILGRYEVDGAEIIIVVDRRADITTAIRLSSNGEVDFAQLPVPDFSSNRNVIYGFDGFGQSIEIPNFFDDEESVYLDDPVSADFAMTVFDVDFETQSISVVGVFEFDVSQTRFIDASDFGDVNQDGTRDLLDVAPFVTVLLRGGYLYEADMNQDGAVDLLDVQPFVHVLTN